MTVRVLGPLEVGGGASLSPRERAIFAALVARWGSSVSPDELAEAYWGSEPPRTWPQQVKTSVARIRSRLGHEAILTKGSDYALGLDPSAVDALEFERLVSNARGHALHDEHDRAVDAYRRALRLWRGPAFADIAEWEPARSEAMRLSQMRHSAEEELLEERVRLGEHRAVIADAERLVREEPLRESRWAILALANYRAGRQADALAALRALRERLADELGVEPSPRIRELETAMLRQDPTLDAAAPSGPVSAACPYRGLTPYSPDEAAEFFGRDEEVQAVLDRLQKERILTVIGASGSGKSSLILAGVVPRLTERGRQCQILRAGPQVPSALRATANQAVRPDIVVVDQAEAVFQLSSDEIAAVDDLLAEISRRSVVVLTLRSDFLDQAIGWPRMGTAIARGLYALGPLTEEGLRRAVAGPAEGAGLRLERGLIEVILRDAGDRQSTLPHVSHALLETWARREGATLTVEGYEDAGGIAGAVAQSAESLYRSLSPADAEVCRFLMMRMISRDADGRSVRRTARLTPLLDDPQRRKVLDRLVSARLVTTDGDTVVVAHEAIATAWPRLDGWLEEDAEGARLVSQVAAAAELWSGSGRRVDDLLRGARLQAALEWRDRATPDLTDVERSFLDASSLRDRDEHRELAERAAREKRDNRRLRFSLAGVAVLLVVAMASAGVAVVRGNQAAAAAEDALIEAVTSTSTSLVRTNRDIAALLAVEAHRRWPGEERVERALVASMIGAGPLVGTTTIPDATWRIGAWPIPGGEQVAVVREFREVGIHDLATGELLRHLDRLPDTEYGIRPWVRVSADGSTLAVVQHAHDPSGEVPFGPMDIRDELVHFFDLRSGMRIGEPVRVDAMSTSADANPDGSLLTWASVGRLIVVDRDTGSVRQTDAVHPDSAPPEEAWAASAFLPDGRIAVTNADDEGMLLDPTTLEILSRFAVGTGSGGGAVAATDDGGLVSLGTTHLSAWHPEHGVLWTRDIGTDCSRLAVSSAHRRIVCGDELGTLSRWDLDTGEPVGQDWSYQQSGAGDLALSDDETELLLLSTIAPRIARVRIDGSGPASAELGHSDLAVAWGFDPSGRRIVLGDRESLSPDAPIPRYEIWDVTTRERMLRIPEDLDVADTTLVTDPRWVSDHEVLVWLPDLETNLFDNAVIDVRTGDLARLDLPDNVWWAFADPTAEVVYIALADLPETDAEEFSGVIAYDPATWKPLSFRVPIEGEVAHVSATPDRELVAVTEFSPREGDYRTTVFDAAGEPLASGLPRSQAAVLLADGTLVAAAASQLERYDGRTLELIGALPGGGFAWHLTASRDGTVLRQGSQQEGLAIVDAAANRLVGEVIPSTSDGELAAAISWDGEGFAVSGADGAQYWTLDPAEHARAACRFVGREPTPQEWRTYFSDFGSQHPVCDFGG